MPRTTTKVVLEFFEKADGPLNAGAVAEGTGLDRKEVDKIMAKVKRKVRSFPETLLLGD